MHIALMGIGEHAGDQFIDGPMNEDDNSITWDNMATYNSEAGIWITYEDPPEPSLHVMCSWNSEESCWIINQIVVSDVPNGELIETPEGIHIGSTYDEVIEAYGEAAYDDAGLMYVDQYNTELLFLFTDDGVVNSIGYMRFR